MHPVYTEEFGGGEVSSLSSDKAKTKIEPTYDAKQHNRSGSQRCEDYAWRRLVIRCSAARRPYKKRYYFQQRIVSEVEVYEVSHAVPVVDEDKTNQTKNSQWCQCVKRGQDRIG